MTLKINEWTKDWPTECGWYWCAIDPAEWPGLPEDLYRPYLFMVYGTPGEMRVEDTVNGEDYAASEMTGRFWAGPLTPPELPTVPTAVETPRCPVTF